MRPHRRHALLLLAPLLVAPACSVDPGPAAFDVRDGPTPTAPAAAPLTQQLLPLLGAWEHVPTRDELLALAPAEALVEALAEVWRDEGRHLHPRIQALASLRFFPTPAARSALELALDDPTTPLPARRAAVKAYGAAFGAEATPRLIALLDARDPHTRDAAARALGALGTEHGRRALATRLKAEPEEAVRRTLRGALER